MNVNISVLFIFIIFTFSFITLLSLHKRMTDDIDITEFLRREDLLRRQVDLAVNTNNQIRLGMNNNINNGRTSDALKIPGDVNYSNVDTVMGKIFNNDYNSKALREITYRRMTRYWLENKHLWSSSPLPVEKKFVSFEPWRGGVSL